MRRFVKMVVVVLGLTFAKPVVASEAVSVVDKSAGIARLVRLCEIAACDAVIVGSLKVLLTNPHEKIEHLVSSQKINRETANQLIYVLGASFATALFTHASLDVTTQEVGEVGLVTLLLYGSYLASQNAAALNPLPKLAAKAKKLWQSKPKEAKEAKE